MSDHRSWPSAQKIEIVCESCHKTFIGHRRTLYCPECRYIVSHSKKRQKPQARELGTVTAHCPCGKDFLVSANDAKKYAMVNGKIYKYCPKCEWKRGQYDLEEHRVIW